MKVHRLRLPGRSLCSIRSNRKWCKRRGSSLQCQNCFFVYPIIDCNLKNLPICTQRFLRRVSSVFCPELRRQSQPQQFLSILSCLYFLILLLFSISRIIESSLNCLYPLINNWFIISKSSFSVNFHAFRYFQAAIRKLFPKLKCHYR